MTDSCAGPALEPMEPQRKQGICLSSSPVLKRPDSYGSFRNQTDLVETGVGHSTASLPRNHSTTRNRNLASRELITFRGHKGNSNQVVVENMPTDGRPTPPPPEGSSPAQHYSGPLAENLPDEQRPDAGPVMSSWKRSSDIFQVVPLDGPANSLGTSAGRITPINPYGKNQTDNEKSDSSRAINLAPPFKFAGFIGTIASAFVFSLGVFFVKLMPLEDELPEKAKIVTFRGISLMTLTAITILCQGSTFLVRRDEILVNFIRSFVGFFGSFGIYVAVQYITIAEASALAYSSPLWTCILGYFILRERLPITLVAAFPLGALGLILIAHPDLLLNVQDEVLSELERHHQRNHLNRTVEHIQIVNLTFQEALKYHLNDSQILDLELAPADETEIYLEARWPGVVIAIGTSFVLAIVNICLKFRKTTPIQTTTFWLGFACFSLGLLIQCLFGFGSWPTTWLEWGLHAGIGIASFFGQALFQWSLMYESAGTISVVRTVDIVFSFTWSALFLREDVLWTSVAGAALIALVVALIMFNDQIQRTLSACCCGSNNKTKK